MKPRQLLRICALLWPTLLLGCDRHGVDIGATADSQVAAQVNQGEITVHQIWAVMRLHPGLQQQWGPHAYAHALDKLIDDELAAQEAKRLGLAQDPSTLQAMAVARREVLAFAYRSQLGPNAAEATAVTSDEAQHRYYLAHPERYAHRRRYVLLQTCLPVPSVDPRALRQGIEGAQGVEALNQLLKQAKTSAWQQSLTPTDDLLPELSRHQAGASWVMERPDGWQVITIVQAQAAPVDFAHAAPEIAARLQVEAEQDAQAQALALLRARARISRAMHSPAGDKSAIGS